VDWQSNLLLLLLLFMNMERLLINKAYHVEILMCLPIIRGPFAAIGIHDMQAVGMPWFWGLVLKTVVQANEKKEGKREFWDYPAEKKSSLLVRKSFKGESFEPTFDE
jgi:hypothetical protein